jgi:hypothetical protein
MHFACYVYLAEFRKVQPYKSVENMKRILIKVLNEHLLLECQTDLERKVVNRFSFLFFTKLLIG